MRRRFSVLLLVLLSGIVLGRSARAGAADAAPGGAMRMYRDPQTGAVGAPPAAPQRESEASTARAAAAPTDAAVPEPVQGPAGGFKVRLGAAQRAAVVRHASGGEPPMHECVSGAQGERE